MGRHDYQRGSVIDSTRTHASQYEHDITRTPQEDIDLCLYCKKKYCNGEERAFRACKKKYIKEQENNGNQSKD